MKINFTKEHYQKMCELLLGMLVKNEAIPSKMGTPLNVVELLHTTTVNSLNNIRLALGKEIEKLENQDEWVASGSSQSKLEDLKSKKELVNLVIGYKRFTLEVNENKMKKAELRAKLNALKESQKTPEDQIKELEVELASLESPTF